MLLADDKPTDGKSRGDCVERRDWLISAKHLPATPIEGSFFDA